MEKALAVANYFIKKANESHTELSLLKLVKLVYISHGWYLANFPNTSLLDEPVYAWKYGPVVKSVYNTFKECGNSQITYTAKNFFNKEIELSNKTVVPALLDAVWNQYGQMNGLQLSSLTHQQNTPWDIIYNQEYGKNRNNAVIPNAIIQSHYISKLYQAKKIKNTPDSENKV